RWGESAREKIVESKQRTKDWKKKDFEKVGRDYDELHRAFTEAINRGLKPSAAEVQLLVKRHLGVVDRFWTPNRQSYIGLGKMYCEHPDFRKQYDKYHPKLAEFLADAMTAYAEANL